MKENLKKITGSKTTDPGATSVTCASISITLIKSALGYQIQDIFTIK